MPARAGGEDIKEPGLPRSVQLKELNKDIIKVIIGPRDMK
jgi:hypothetical protein